MKRTNLLFLILFLTCFMTVCCLPAVAQSEKDITAINEIGLLYYNSGNYSEAINEFKKILKMKPDHDVAHFNLGCVYQKMKQHKAALREFQSVLDLLPDDREARSKLEGTSRTWMATLKMDLETNPADPQLRNDLGVCHLYLGELDEAYENISTAIKVKANFAEAHYNLSQYYLKKGSYDQALDPAKKAARLDSRDALYTKNYQKIAQFLGQSSTPEPEVRPDRSQDADLESLLKTARGLFDEGRYDQAREWFDKVLRLDGKNSTARDYMERIKELEKNAAGLRDAFHSGEKNFKRESWDEAITEFEKALKLDPQKKSPYYRDLLRYLAEACMKQEKFDRAESYLNEMAVENPGDYKVLFNLGLLAHLRGDRNKAREYFRKAKLAPDIDDRHVAEINEIISGYEWGSRLPWLIGIIGTLVALIVGFAVWWNLPAVKKGRILRQVMENHKYNRWPDVIRDCEKLSAMNLGRQEFIQVHDTLAMAYLNSDQSDRAILTAKRVLAKDPHDKTAHEVLGKSYFRKKIVSTEAILEYRKLLDSDKGNVEILKLIGDYYVRSAKDGKLGRADTMPDNLLEMFKDYLSKDGTNRELVRHVANMLRQRKDSSSGAVPIYRISLEAEPDNYRLREVLAKALFEAREYQAAIDECLLIFKENIGSTQTHRIFIDCNMALDCYDDLILEYEKMCIAYPDNPDLERRLAELKKQGLTIEGGGRRQGPVEVNYGICLDKGADLFSRGDINKAIAELRLAKKDERHRIRASLLLVRCYVRKDLIDLAREEFDALGKLDFISPEMKEVTYELARVLEDKGQFRDALRLYDMICKVDIGFRDVFDKFEELHDYVAKF